ncbi:LysR substrate-binding domain-containing protein [Sulfitobacter guttiformis]|uniref:DNA-binding transcriptional LysR family regulator n=1 Tax=Sulfitobacter guttiformis TaxID=74349 RepID=A0A420DP14_9RHOB|nr:LysR substrate-binding domain-containing protein [Sulfitobacter guttiformis]KIN73322.1 Transcriptional regulator, LysR family protein [Sulfitobacter guttiformis KCTC 32187]RKE95992.1 DNA-binding transcriptional LysR family regulator [Sulfitobacter guttiformis]
MSGGEIEADAHAGITLRELEVLQALVNAGTAMSAARKLGISQSAVSRRLAQLEERLGSQLFLRSGGRLVPTVQALSINEQLKPVFETLARIASRIDNYATSKTGTLTIAAPPTIAHRFLPGRISEFKKRNPDLHIIFEVIASDALVTGIAEGRFDVALTDSIPPHEGIQTDLLISTQAICLLPVNHPLAKRDTITAQDLHHQPFVALSRRHASRGVVERVLDRLGVEPRITIEASTNVSAADFVRGGLGLALVNPFPIIHQLGPDIVALPFSPALNYNTAFVMASSRAPSAATLAFIEEIRASLDRSAYPALL